MKAIILTRVSSKEQEDGHSLAAQERRLTEYAYRKGLEVLKTYQIIESSTRGERKLFKQALEFCKKHSEKIAIIADAVDRVQRSFKDSVYLDELVKKGKIELHFLREGMIISSEASSMQVMQWDFAVMGAKSYVLQLSENVRRSLDYKVKRGEFTGYAPTGYLNTRDKDNKSVIVPDAENAPKVQQIFTMYSLGRISISELCKIAREMGLKTRMGKPMSNSSLHYMLQNPFYYGEMRCKGSLIPHIYTPLISKELWLKCQKVRHDNSNSLSPNQIKYAALPFLYRGMIKCERTGRICVNEIKKVRSGNQINYVVCYTRNGKRIYVQEEKISNEITGILKEFQVPQETFEFLLSELKKNKKSEIEYRNLEVGRLKEALSKSKKASDRLLELLLDETISKETFKEKSEQLSFEQAELTQKIANHSKADTSYNETLSELFDILQNCWDIFQKSKNIDLKRMLLKLFFKELRLNEGVLKYDINPAFLTLKNATFEPTEKPINKGIEEPSTPDIQTGWGGWIRTNE